MRFVLIADTLPPLRTSGAEQLLELFRVFARQPYILDGGFKVFQVPLNRVPFST